MLGLADLTGGGPMPEELLLTTGLRAPLVDVPSVPRVAAPAAEVPFDAAEAGRAVVRTVEVVPDVMEDEREARAAAVVEEGDLRGVLLSEATGRLNVDVVELETRGLGRVAPAALVVDVLSPDEREGRAAAGFVTTGALGPAAATAPRTGGRDALDERDDTSGFLTGAPSPGRAAEGRTNFLATAAGADAGSSGAPAGAAPGAAKVSTGRKQGSASYHTTCPHLARLT